MSFQLSSIPSFEIERYIQSWRLATNDEENGGSMYVSNLFKSHLGQAPFYLKYSTDPSLPDAVMIYPSKKSDLSNSLVCECNGIVLDTRDWRVVAAGMPLLTHCSLPEFHNALDRVSTTDVSHFEYAEDGTVVRVFWYANRWNVSTNRRLDARSATWSSSRSFYDLFCDAIQEGQKQVKSKCPDATSQSVSLIDIDYLFDKELDVDKVYSFVLVHPEHYHVIPYDRPRLILVSIRDMTTRLEIPLYESHELSFALYPSRPSTVKDALDNDQWTLVSDKRGIILSDWSNALHVHRYICDRPSFTGSRLLRKNMPTMALSYLACQTPEDQYAFRLHFPTFSMCADQLDRRIFNLANDVRHIYRQSFVLKQYFIPPDDQLYRVLRTVHQYYRATRKPIHLTHVLECVRRLNPYFIQQLLDLKDKQGRLAITNPLPHDVGMEMLQKNMEHKD